jgi:ABC-type multidrug transport system fused ATPase/permease subunit
MIESQKITHSAADHKKSETPEKQTVKIEPSERQINCNFTADSIIETKKTEMAKGSWKKSISDSLNSSLQMFRDVATVVSESFKFNYQADPKAIVSRMAFSALQPFQFLAYGILIEKIAKNVTQVSSVADPAILLPVLGVFAFKGALDIFQARSATSQTIQESKIHSAVQEKIRSIQPKSLERLNIKEISDDYKKICWGGIWGFVGSGTQMIQSVGTLVSIGVSIGFSFTYASPATSIALLGVAGFHAYKAVQLTKIAITSDEEIAQKRTKASERAWSRIWPNFARLYRILGIQSVMDNLVAKEQAEIVVVERSLSKTKNFYNDIGASIGAIGGTVGFLSLTQSVLSKTLAYETAVFIGLTMVPIFFSSLDSMGNSLIAMLKGKPALDAIKRLEIARKQEETKEGSQEINWANSIGAELKVENLHFAYPPKRKGLAYVPILREINLEITPGQLIAIVGDNGAGKSTLLQLLDRSYSSLAGAIVINGTNIQTVTDQSLFSGLKSLPQQPEAVNGFSLRKFLSWGRESANLAEDPKLLGEILDRLGLNQILENEIENEHGEKTKEFANGLDTLMGAHENGVNLSGGQLALLYVAYMLYSNAKIICFDEPEKAISQERQKEFFKTIMEADKFLGYKPTILLVTHVLDNAIKADKLIYLEKGTTGASGFASHNELYASNDNYRKWYDKSTNA